MDLIETARGQTYSCECGKLIPVRKKEEVAEAEVVTPAPGPDTKEAKEHRRRLRRARKEYLLKSRTLFEKLDDYINFILPGAVLIWFILAGLMFLLWPFALVLILFGVAAMIFAERGAPAEEDTLEIQGSPGAGMGMMGGAIGGLVAGAAAGDEGGYSKSSTKLFSMFRNLGDCWREVLLLLVGLGMIFSGIGGGIFWLILLR